MYRELQPAHITKTLDELCKRIEQRFPSSGLSKVCAELLDVSLQTQARVESAARPNVALRAGILAVLGLGGILLYKVGAIVEFKRESENLYGVLQGIDSAFNIMLLMGGLMLYLSSLEARWKRHQIMEHLHELRSIVHVIDMHQLSKDPSSDRPATVAVAEPGAPQRTISAFELSRYLDYCSEMLSLTAQVAALYAQSTRDSIVVEAVSSIDQITANLSHKIWQKITLVQGREAQVAPLPALRPSAEAPAPVSAASGTATPA